MYRRQLLTLSDIAWASAVATAVCIALQFAGVAQAAVTATGDPEDRFGAEVDRIVYTVDPFDTELVSKIADRGVIGNRRLRQTFQNPTTFNVGQINISFNVGGGSIVGGLDDTGLKLAFYEVADVLATSFTPGPLVREITLQPGSMPSSDEILRFDLTGGDVFTLPQRNTGNQGYGLQISTPNELESDGNPGGWVYTNVADPLTDYYAGGLVFDETGTNLNFRHRDIGFSLLASTAPVCDPGDVDCDGNVDTVDLDIIAANFRTSAPRELGDLTGNGFVDFDDFGEWKTYYTGPAIGAGHFAFLSVPEPSGILLLVSALVFSVVSRRNRR